MARHGVTHTFLPPTALKMLRTVENPQARWPLKLVSVASGGESLGLELIEWGRKDLGLTINEFYCQTECNMIVSSCSALFDPLIGTMGKAVPGHEVRTEERRVGEEGGSKGRSRWSPSPKKKKAKIYIGDISVNEQEKNKK